MNRILYCDVLQNESKISTARLPKKMPYTFQQNLVLWHTSKLVGKKIAKMKLNMLEWVLKSPSLTSVERLLIRDSVLKLSIQKHKLKDDWSKDRVILINSCVLI